GGMHWGLLAGRHRERLDLEDVAVVEGVAAASGLDLERFRSDVADRSILDALARDHTAAVVDHGVFGTPTFVFPGGDAAYVRLAPAALEGGAVESFERLVSVAASSPATRSINLPYNR